MMILGKKTLGSSLPPGHWETGSHSDGRRVPVSVFSGHTNDTTTNHSGQNTAGSEDIVFVLAGTHRSRHPDLRAPCPVQNLRTAVPVGRRLLRRAACATNCNESWLGRLQPLQPKDSERPAAATPAVNIPVESPSRSISTELRVCASAPEILADARGHRPRGAVPKDPSRHVRLPGGTRPCAEKPLRRRRPG
jgi:hypothetical protein